MNTPYSTDYAPPIPVLSIQLGFGGRSPWLGPLEGIIDTGADSTIIPERLARQLKAIPLNPGQLLTQWGEAHPVQIYLMDFQIGDLVLPGVVTAGDPAAEEIVIGRNILNKLPLFLDGPMQQASVPDDTTVKRLRSR